MRTVTKWRLAMAAISAILGAWISILMLDSPNAAWYPAPDWLAALVVVGGVVVSVLTYLSGVPERMVKRNAEFWESGVFLTSMAINLAFSGCAALAWGLGLLVLIGGR